MPVSITPLLADRLDISEEKAESLLRTMLQELRRRAETDGVRLPELGTFQVEDGTLTFEPSPSLRRRVNQQYEGLSAEDVSLPAEASVMGAPDPSEETALSEDLPPEPAPAAEDQGYDSFTIISLILAVLFVLGAGWFVLDRTQVFSPDPSDSPPVATEQSPANQETGPTTDTVTIPPASTGDPSDQAPAATTARNWTIIVASRTSRAAAQATADDYTTRFDSVEVVSGTVDNQTWYRVTVGRYPSEADAERVLNDRATDLPSGAWIHRLQ